MIIKVTGYVPDLQCEPSLRPLHPPGAERHAAAWPSPCCSSSSATSSSASTCVSAACSWPLLNSPPRTHPLTWCAWRWSAMLPCVCRYATLSSAPLRRTYALIGLIWLVSSASIVPDILIVLATEPLKYFYSKVFCVRENLFPKLIEKNNIYHIVFLVLLWIILVYIYINILVAAKGVNADAKKARDTILLHGFQLLLCMLTFIAPVLKRNLFLWFPKNYSNSLFVCYIIIQIFPRFLSPIVYGLRDKTFRRYLKRSLPM